jgi:PAS domain S-box-containing protein
MTAPGGEAQSLDRLQQENQALRRALAPYQKIFMKASDPIIIEDLANRVIDLNEEAERFYGWPRTKLIGQPVKILVPPEHHQHLDQLCLRCRRGEEVRNVEALHWNNQQERFHVLLTLLLLIDETASPIGIATFSEDITPQKQAEQALRQTNEWFQAAIEASLVPFSILSTVRDEMDEIIDFHYEFMNQAGLDAHQLSQAEVVGQRLLELFPAHQELGLFDTWRDVLKTGQPWQAEAFYYQDARPEARANSSYLDLGVTKLGDALVVTWRDMTHRRAVEQALRESEARLRLALEAGQVGVWHWEFGDTVMGNQRLSELLALPADQGSIKVVDIAQRLYPDDLTQIRHRLNQLFESGDQFRQELRVIHPNGQVLWLANAGRLVRDEQGQPQYMIGLTFDITDRTHAELARSQLRQELETERDQLKALTETLTLELDQRKKQVRLLSSALTRAEQQERDRITRVLHDDLQQLLYSLRIRLEVLEGQFSGSGIATSTGQLEGIIQGMEQAIDITRTLVGELSLPAFKTEPLADALNRLVIQMEIAYQLKVILSVQDQARLLAKDIQSLLLQIVRELLFNIVKHAGTLQGQLSVWQEGQVLMVRVEDHGQGFKVEQLRSAQQDKVGFGLRHIEERLAPIGGRMEIESAPGQGARVTLIIPTD